MVSLPLWAVFAVSFGSPLLAFLGVLVAQLIGRKGARELETRSKREETLRTLRWAAELSVGPDDRLAELGVAELQALLGSDLLEEAQKTFVEAALSAVYGDPEEQLEQLEPGGEPIDVYVDAGVTPSVPEDPGVRSDPRTDEGSGRDG